MGQGRDFEDRPQTEYSEHPPEQPQPTCECEVVEPGIILHVGHDNGPCPLTDTAKT